MKKITLFIALLLCAHTISSQLDMIETEEMQLVTYDYGHKYILNHAGRCFHNALQFHKKLFEYEPSEQISLLIQDFGDYGNAGATAVPKNAISMGLSPFSYAFETSPAGERVFTMMNHELIHVMALDNANASDRFYRKVFFGKVDPSAENPVSMIYSYMTNPRRYSPRWYHEGIASYVETWMSGGLGLALGSYDEMVFRTRVLENARIYNAQGLESEGVTSDFQGRSNSYLYGTRFMGYLSYTYGPDKMIDWIKRNKRSKAFFAGQFKKVYGKKINTAWDEWIDFERKWQNQNLEVLREFPITDMEDVRPDAIGSVSYPHYDKKRNCIYVAVNNPGKVPHIAAINLETGEMKRLTDVKGAALFYVTSLIYDEASDILYYTSDNDKWRDLNSFNLKTKESKLLQKDFRTGDLAYNKADKSIWGIKHLNGFSTILKVVENPETMQGEKAGKYSDWDQIHTLEYGQDIFDIDVSPDGNILSAAVTDLNGNQSLIFYNMDSLHENIITADTVFNFAVSSPQTFRFTDDGKFMYGTSYYTGVSNVFRVNVETKEIDVMSNAVTGYFRPTLLDDERIFVFNFKSDGFQPVIIPNETVESVSNISFLGNITIEKYPQLADWQLPILRESDLDMSTLITSEDSVYRAGKEMTLEYAYPIVVGYKNNLGIGYQMSISDPFNFKQLNMAVSFTPREWTNSLLTDRGEDFPSLDDEELFHFDFNYSVGNFSVDGSYNQAAFHDLFGPSQSSRKGARLGISYDKTLTYDPPNILTFNVGVSGFYGLDQSPEFQQIVLTGFNNNFFLNLTSSINYSSSKGSLGAVDAEKGIQATLWGSLASSAGNFYPRIIGLFNYGIPLPGKHFSLWLRTAAGSSFSDIYNPFTRFGFGAFGNNYIDYQSSKQYRGPFSFPGVRFDSDRSIIGQRFAKAMAEFVLPALRFRKLGGFNFFANWVQPSFFGSIVTSQDNLEFINNNLLANAGAQIDIRMVTFSLLPSTLSIGYAKAWDIDGPESYNEFMISLKLLH